MAQMDLLTPSVASPVALPDGARYVADFVSAAEELRLIEIIDGGPWLDDLTRRVQHYGFRYDYKSRSRTSKDRLEPLPRWAIVHGDRLVAGKFFEIRPEQVIVNEYEPGQGIAPHVDRSTCFGPTVASVSLLSPIVMDFIDRGDKRSMKLDPRSAIILSGASRDRWRHGIAPRRYDEIDGARSSRRRRLSLTFRNVML